MDSQRNSHALPQIRKRDGRVVEFDASRIVVAVSKCLEEVARSRPDRPSQSDLERVAGEVATATVNTLRPRAGGEPTSVESVQDAVERQLMAAAEYDAAKAYILYRQARAEARKPAVPAEVRAAFEADSPHFQSAVQRFQHLSKYARFDERLGRRETWTETVDGRLMPQFRKVAEREIRERRQLDPDQVISAAEWDWLRRMQLTGQASSAMRVVQMAGPAMARDELAGFNCATTTLTALKDFADSFWVLLQGCGLGFSVESEFTEQLPRIRKRPRNVPPTRFVVEDSSEGWCDSVLALLEALFDGRDIDFDYSPIRNAGAILRTKGGTASGSGPLITLHEFIRKRVRSRAGKRLRTIDVHDIKCLIGKIVQVGGVRRAALISVSDLEDEDMRTAKVGAFWNNPDQAQRTMSNNSAAYTEKPPMERFLREWLSLIESKSGERGIFNREAAWNTMPERRRKAMPRNVQLLTNPCGEILLMPKQVCNLSLAIVRPGDDEAALAEKVRAAAIFGTIQSAMTRFTYVSPEWQENAERERLLGVDLLGAMDNPLLRGDNPDRDALLERLKEVVLATNRDWADRLGIPHSMAVTCIKPGGNSSVRYGTGQSMSGWLSQYMIRNTELAKVNPLHALLVEQGVPHETSYRDPGTSVFSWPMEAPEGAQVVSDLVTDPAGKVVGVKPRLSALQQLADWLAFKRHWAEHSVSVTIYVAEDEWLDVGKWVWDHWDEVTGLAFLPLDGGIYKQAPMQPVTKAQYDEFVSRFPAIDWARLVLFEKDAAYVAPSREFACVGDKCMI